MCRAALCCVVSCVVVLCCCVLRCVVPCCVVMCCDWLSCLVLCHDVLCCTVTFCVVQYNAVLCCLVLCWFAALCCAEMLFCGCAVLLLCCAMLWRILLCCDIVFCRICIRGCAAAVVLFYCYFREFEELAIVKVTNVVIIDFCGVQQCPRHVIDFVFQFQQNYASQAFPSGSPPQKGESRTPRLYSLDG